MKPPIRCCGSLTPSAPSGAMAKALYGAVTTGQWQLPRLPFKEGPRSRPFLFSSADFSLFAQLARPSFSHTVSGRPTPSFCLPAASCTKASTKHQQEAALFPRTSGLRGTRGRAFHLISQFGYLPAYLIAVVQDNTLLCDSHIISTPRAFLRLPPA